MISVKLPEETPVKEEAGPIATFYAVRNNKGEYYRTYAQGGRRSGWVKELTDARLWTTIGPAKGKITALSNEHPKDPVPELIEFVVREVNVVDQKARVAQAKVKKAREDAERVERQRLYELQYAQSEFDKAKSRLDKLKRDEPHDPDCGCKSCVGM